MGLGRDQVKVGWLVVRVALAVGVRRTGGLKDKSGMEAETGTVSAKTGTVLNKNIRQRKP